MMKNEDVRDAQTSGRTHSLLDKKKVAKLGKHSVAGKPRYKPDPQTTYFYKDEAQKERHMKILKSPQEAPRRWG